MGQDLINKINYEHKKNSPELASLEPELTEAKPSGLCASLGLIGVDGGVDGLWICNVICIAFKFELNINKKYFKIF